MRKWGGHRRSRVPASGDAEIGLVVMRGLGSLDVVLQALGEAEQHVQANVVAEQKNAV